MKVEKFNQERLKEAFGFLSKRINDGEFDIIGFHEFSEPKGRYYLRLRLKKTGRQFVILLTDNTMVMFEDDGFTEAQAESHKPQSQSPAETDTPSEPNKNALD